MVEKSENLLGAGWFVLHDGDFDGSKNGDTGRDVGVRSVKI